MGHSFGLLVFLLISTGIDGALKNNRKTALGGGGGEGLNIILPKASLGNPDVSSQTVELGGEGFAQVGLSLDLRAFLQSLHLIPEIQQGLFAINKKVDELSTRNNDCPQVEKRIASLQKELVARLNKLEEDQNTIKKDINNINQIFKYIKSKIDWIDDQKEASPRGFGGMSCQNETDLQANVEKILTLLPQILRGVDKSIIKAVGPLVPPLNSIQQDGKRILASTSKILETLQSGRLACSFSDSSPTSTFVQRISNLGDALDKIPSKIFHSLTPQFDGVKEILPRVLEVLNLEKQIKTDVSGIKTGLNKSVQEIKGWFLQNQKSLVAVKKIVTETTEVVQHSAAAAVTASRNLKCGNSKKNDLE